MSNTTVMKLKVKSLGKFGFFTEDSTRGYNYSKNFSEADKAKVVPGVEFEGEVYTAESGAQYLNKIVNTVSLSVEQPKSKAVEKKETRPEAKSDTMTKAEWSAKDRSQLIGGLSHDAATLTAAAMSLQPYNNTEEVLKEYKLILEGLLKIREEVK